MHRGLSRKWLRVHWWPLRAPGRTSSSRTLELSYGVMRPDQATAWYRRMSIVYALGTWWLLGSAIFLTRKQRMSDYGEDEEDDSRDEMFLSTNEDSDFAMERAEPSKGFYTKTIVKYSENSVPVTQRIMNYLSSWTGGPGSQA